jgi:DNA-binding NarL/FixJ family response regulator
VARVAAFIPDLLFGSNVLGALQAAGHEVELVSDPAKAQGADVLIVDLTAEPDERLAKLRDAHPDARTLAFYSHIENHVRERAHAAGLDLVVPRSRMAREAASLVERLSASDQ